MRRQVVGYLVGARLLTAVLRLLTFRCRLGPPSPSRSRTVLHLPLAPLPPPCVTSTLFLPRSPPRAICELAEVDDGVLLQEMHSRITLQAL